MTRCSLVAVLVLVVGCSSKPSEATSLNETAIPESIPTKPAVHGLKEMFLLGDAGEPSFVDVKPDGSISMTVHDRSASPDKASEFIASTLGDGELRLTFVGDRFDHHGIIVTWETVRKAVVTTVPIVGFAHSAAGNQNQLSKSVPASTFDNLKHSLVAFDLIAPEEGFLLREKFAAFQVVWLCAKDPFYANAIREKAASFPSRRIPAEDAARFLIDLDESSAKAD